MSSIERHPLTGEYVIVAPERGGRAQAFAGRIPRNPVSPADCPFCPGNEDQTPPEILRRGDPWRMRVVPNRYPAIDPSSGGVSEVAIESGRHITRFDDLDLDDAKLNLEVYRERFRALEKEPRLRHLAIFKNSGEGSGQSIEHLHSQIVGVALVPPRVQKIAERLRNSPCVLCTTGTTNGPRVLHRGHHFVWVVSAVSAHPFEQWIVPLRHSPTLGTMTDQECDELAWLMQQAVRTMRSALDDPPFNWLFQNSPLPAEPSFHWFVEIFPRLTIDGGFEKSTGIAIDVIGSEKAAAVLKRAVP